MVAARWALPVVLAALRPTRAEEDVGACLVSSAPCDVSRRCGEAEDAFPHSCLATPIPAWRVPFDRIQCCFQCCMVFWLDEFGMRRNNELWMRAHAELHPKDTHTFEHIDRQGLDELPPESVLNVNSRAATLAHYYVEFRGRVGRPAAGRAARRRQATPAGQPSSGRCGPSPDAATAPSTTTSQWAIRKSPVAAVAARAVRRRRGALPRRPSSSPPASPLASRRKSSLVWRVGFVGAARIAKMHAALLQAAHVSTGVPRRS